MCVCVRERVCVCVCVYGAPYHDMQEKNSNNVHDLLFRSLNLYMS